MSCPNINSQAWKNLVSKIGFFEAFREFKINGDVIPDASKYEATLKGSDSLNKIVSALSNPEVATAFEQYYNTDQEKFYSALGPVIGYKEAAQLESWAKANQPQDVDDLLTGLLAESVYTVAKKRSIEQLPSQKVGNNSFQQALNKPTSVDYALKAVDILSNLTDKQKQDWLKWKKGTLSGEQLVERLQIPKEQKAIVLSALDKNKSVKEIADDIQEKYAYDAQVNTATYNTPTGEVETSIYSNLTVPGGTNGSYREVNIESPLITLPKSHAQFNTEHTLMFSRMDDAQNYTEKNDKILRIQEFQQPDFLKQIRNNPNWINEQNFSETEKGFLNLLFGKNEGWIRFGLKSLIQNAAKEGYTKIRIPKGDTSAKVEGHSTLEEFKKQKEDRIKELEKQLIPETNQIITESLNKLNVHLENYLNQFGFNTEQLDDLKQTTGYSIIGATDFLEKTIFVQKENINKAYTKEAAYSIFNLLGRKNLLRKDLIASIHLIDNYENLKSKYVNSKLSDYKIRELIAVDYLQSKLIEAHKEVLPTTNKAVSKDVTAKNKLEYTILKIKKWWSDIIRNFFKSYKRGYIEDVFNQIANDVINNNTRLFNLSKNIPYKKMELIGKQKEINDSLVKFGAINSGSYSLNRQGNLTRDDINDLDYFLPYQIKDTFIKDVVKKYPQAVFSEPYSGVMGNRSLTLSLKIDDVKIDFFLPTSQEESDKNKIIVIDGVKHHHWKNIFDAKIRIGSQKHLSDLAGFTPFTREWSVYNVSWRNPLILKDDYLNIVGQRHYNFDFIQSKYNSKEYSSGEQVIQSDNIKTYWDKNLEQTALNYFKNNNIDFEKSIQYQNLLSYFNNKRDKAIIAYYLTFSENFKKFYGNIDSRKNLPSFVINSISGNYSKNSILLDEYGDPVIFYHGAGTMFDKFSKDYFLSGEGAMAYGAGFYSTNYKPTADNYRDTAKSAIDTFNKLVQEQNQQLLDLISKLKVDINENTLIGFMSGSLTIEDTKSKAKLLNLLGLTETKALYVALTNPLYWQKDISKQNKDLIESHFGVKLKNNNSGRIYRELEKTLKISDKELSARLYQIGIDGVINIAGGGQAVGGFSHKKGEKHVIFFEPIQAKAVNNSGLFSLNNENMYDPIEIKENKQPQITLNKEQRENNNKINNEINQLKQELERVETEGFDALRPIYNFYENTVTNILKKQGYNPQIITDEYGNKWNEITLNNTRDLAPVQFQKLTAEEKAKTIEQVTKEHRSITALKDLSAKLAWRIGGKVEFVNKTDVDWKAYNQGMTSVLNEAYMTPDTPFHEILAHPIIRVIKKSNSELYQSLLKELETGRGKEVFEQVKRDYTVKNTPEIIEIEPINTDLGWGREYEILGKTFDTKQKAVEYQKEKTEYYTLEEQQEEAIVTLLGMMAADKLDAKKDATLISKLKELWKQISDFVRQLLLQDEIRIDELPITTTLNDLAEIMAYGNNKIILPGYKVEYSTPLGNKYDTLEEVNNEIRDLADANIEVDLNGVRVNTKDFDIPGYIKSFSNNGYYYRKLGDTWQKIKETDTGTEGDYENISLEETKTAYANEFTARPDLTDINEFIEKNKQYAQSREIIEQWKKENNIQYDPEEVYSRGHQFISTMGAFGKVDLELLFQNMLQHLEDYNRIGAKFELSFHTAPIDNRQVVDINQGGGKVYIVAYPQSNDIAWASKRDNHSGSVWEANKKVSDKPSEIAGVAHTKAPSVDNIDTIEPNLATIIDERNWARNELGIAVTPTNHRVEYDESVPYNIKKLIDNYNKILDDKYGKLVKPEIKPQQEKKRQAFAVIYNGIEQMRKNTLEEAKDFIKLHASKWNRSENDYTIQNSFFYDGFEGKQPTQTRENTTSIESVKSNILSTANRPKNLEELQEGDGFIYFEKDGKYYKEDLSKQEDIEISKEEYEGKKEYTEQALINTKIAALKEVARKYPRSLITSKVVPIDPNLVDNSEIRYSKVPSREIKPGVLAPQSIEAGTNAAYNNKNIHGYYFGGGTLTTSVLERALGRMEAMEDVDSDLYKVLELVKDNLSKNKSLKIKILEDGEAVPGSDRAHYNAETNTINFYRSELEGRYTEAEFLAALAEEFLHALTVAPFFKDASKQTAEEQAYVKEITALYNQALEHASDEEKELLYRLQSPQEFIVGIMQDPAKSGFRTFLARIENSMPIIRRLLDAIIRFFGGKTQDRRRLDILDRGREVVTRYLQGATNLTPAKKFVKRGSSFYADPTLSSSQEAVYNDLQAKLREPSKINEHLDMFFRVVENQIFRMSKNRNFASLREMLKNADGTSKFTDIKDLLREAKKKEDALPDIKYKLRQMAFALKEVEFFSDMVLKKTHEINEDPNLLPEEKIATLRYYLQSIDTWEQFLDGFNKEFESGQVYVKGILSKVAHNFKDTRNYILNQEKTGVVKVLEEQLAPLREQIDTIYNTEITKLEQLIQDGKNVKANRELLKNRREEKKRFDLSKEGILKYVTGEMGDTNVFSGFLEAYISSPDPVVGGFAKYLKTNMYSVEAEMQRRSNAIRAELEPLYKDAGINRSNVAELGKKITFADKAVSYGEDGNLIEDAKVLRMLNPFKDYEFSIARLNKEIRELEQAGNTNGMLTKKRELQDLKVAYMHDEYTPEYYSRAKIFDTPIGQKVKDQRDRILSNIRQKQYVISSMSEPTEDDFEELKLMWREYSRLSSTKNLDGTDKTGDDLLMAQTLQTYQKESKEFYEWIQIPGAFERAKRRYSEDIISKGVEEGTEEYDAAMAGWEKANTRTVVKEEFYEERQQILNVIEGLLSKIPGYKDKTTSISGIWGDIIDQVKGIRDQDGQPVGTEMLDGKIAKVKEDQEKLKELNKAFAGINGLTRAENARRSELIQKAYDRVLSSAEIQELRSLNNKSNVDGLSKVEKEILFKAFDELGALQSKVPTTYYLDTLNDLLEPHGEFVTEETAEGFLASISLQAYMKEDAKLREWINKNHIRVTNFNKNTQREESRLERLYVWNRIVPTNKDHITVEPSIQYMKRKVRDKFVTKKVVGETVDNRGNWLPRLGVQNSPFINQDYFDLQKNDPTSFKILEVFKKYHLMAQEGLSEPHKLWMDVPNVRKSRLEAIQQGDLLEKYKWAKNKISQIFKKQGDDFSEGLGNYEATPEENLDVKVVSTDLFNNELVSVPIKYTSRIPMEEISYDIGQSVMKYSLSAEINKKLTEISPIAQAFESVLEHEGVRDTSKISKLNLFQKGVKKFVNKRGNNRLGIISNLIDREFRGIENKLEMGLVGNKLANALMKASAWGSLALDLPGSVKNLGSAQIQNLIESVGGRYINYKEWLAGNSEFVSKFMPNFIADYNKFGPKTLETQIFEVFDPIQGKFLDHFGREFGASKLRDFVSGSWAYSPRQFGELEAQGSLFLGMARRVRVKQGDKEIRLVEAYELGSDGIIKLKEGVDPEWAPGGKKFNDFKLRMHEVNQRLQGNYAKIDQPEIERYTWGRLITFMRKYFVPAFVNRYGYTRMNVGLTDITEGYYYTTYKMAKNFIKTAQLNWSSYTEYERKNVMKTASEIGIAVALFVALRLLGFDADDEDKFKKLKDNSWVTNHLIYQLMLIKSEEEQFIPWMGFGLNEITRVKNTPSIAFGHMDRYINLLTTLQNDVLQLFTDKDITHYQRKTGFWGKGDRKDIAQIARIFGFTGSTIDPEVAVRNYYLMSTRTK